MVGDARAVRPLGLVRRRLPAGYVVVRLLGGPAGRSDAMLQRVFPLKEVVKGSEAVPTGRVVVADDERLSGTAAPWGRRPECRSSR